VVDRITPSISSLSTPFDVPVNSRPKEVDWPEEFNERDGYVVRTGRGKVYPPDPVTIPLKGDIIFTTSVQSPVQLVGRLQMPVRRAYVSARKSKRLWFSIKTEPAWSKPLTLVVLPASDKDTYLKVRRAAKILFSDRNFFVVLAMLLGPLIYAGIASHCFIASISFSGHRAALTILLGCLYVGIIAALFMFV
jgi:hypothetical protein